MRPSLPLRWPGLLGHRDFRRLWFADALSQVGTRVTFLAIPLLAISTLHASTIEVSVLSAAETLPFLLVGLPAGAWCDRMRCRPVLLTADLVRAAALGSVPLAALLGVLTIGQLYAVVSVVGTATLFFDVSHQSYLPLLVGRDHVVEGNAKLQGNTSVAAVAGPTVAGYLVQWVTAPFTVVLDALSYLWSAAWLRTIGTREPRPRPVEERHLGREIAEGLRFVLGHPVLRPVCLHGSTMLLFQSASNAVTLVFLVRQVGLSTGVIGLLGTLGLLGAVASALVARRLTAAFGETRVLRTAAFCCGLGFLMFPLTDTGPRVGFYVAGNLVAAFCIIQLAVIQVSLRQALTPDRLMGRVNATARFLLWATMPVGALFGGGLATAVGLRPTLTVAAGGVLLSSLWLLLSPLRSQRDVGTDTTAARAVADTTSGTVTGTVTGPVAGSVADTAGSAGPEPRVRGA